MCWAESMVGGNDLILLRGSLNCGGLKNTATQGGPARPQHASQINNTALDEFGQALHTAADRTSPAYIDANGDPRDWNGIPVTPGQVAAVQEHEAEEANPTPEQFGGAVVAAQQAFKNTFGQAAFQDATTMPTPTLNLELHSQSIAGIRRNRPKGRAMTDNIVGLTRYEGEPTRSEERE